MLVAEMPLDMDYVTDDAVPDDALEFAHRGEAAFIVAAAEDDAGLAACFDGALGVRTAQRQRLLAPDGFAGRGHRTHLINMQGMRRREKYGFDIWVGERVLRFCGEPKIMPAGEIACELRLLAHAMDEAQPRAFSLHGSDERLPPAPETDDGCVDHARGEG